MTALIGWMVILTLAGGALVLAVQLLTELRQARRFAPHPVARARKEPTEDHIHI